MVKRVKRLNSCQAFKFGERRSIILQTEFKYIIHHLPHGMIEYQRNFYGHKLNKTTEKRWYFQLVCCTPADGKLRDSPICVLWCDVIYSAESSVYLYLPIYAQWISDCFLEYVTWILIKVLNYSWCDTLQSTLILGCVNVEYLIYIISAFNAPDRAGFLRAAIWFQTTTLNCNFCNSYSWLSVRKYEFWSINWRYFPWSKKGIRCNSIEFDSC